MGVGCVFLINKSVYHEVQVQVRTDMLKKYIFTAAMDSIRRKAFSISAIRWQVM